MRAVYIRRHEMIWKIYFLLIPNTFERKYLPSKMSPILRFEVLKRPYSRLSVRERFSICTRVKPRVSSAQLFHSNCLLATDSRRVLLRFARVSTVKESKLGATFRHNSKNLSLDFIEGKIPRRCSLPL